MLFEGLDPAAPGFSVNDTETRLDPTDGDFVDIIHTHSGSLLQGADSMIEPIGHADFYPNGGQQQPGCLLTKSEEEVDFQEGKPDICKNLTLPFSSFLPKNKTNKYSNPF